ncbi:MAG TPA: hypothetical protein GXX34_09055 [Clostridia bacterium]|nr:hypothetical protein [Clostridia bacterium]
MNLIGNCQTTAMGILPHTDVQQALALALSLDIPFWPQLPRVSYLEDMYVQAAHGFPGIRIDAAARTVTVDTDAFYAELEHYVAHFEDPDYFRLTEEQSLVYHAFLAQDLSKYTYIRGQLIGPVSFGLKIIDPTFTPLIYHDEMRQFLFDFFAKKITVQVEELRRLHPRAFVWVDEPGLEMVFSAYTGYPAERAKQDYLEFLANIPGPKGVHLCGNPDWSFLFDLDLDIISADFLQWGHVITRYAGEFRRFLDRGGIISWGITPTLTEELEELDTTVLLDKLEEMFHYLESKGIDRQQLLRQSWLAPARCCLINLDGYATVERSFAWLKELSARLRDTYGLA